MEYILLPHTVKRKTTQEVLNIVYVIFCCCCYYPGKEEELSILIRRMGQMEICIFEVFTEYFFDKWARSLVKSRTGLPEAADLLWSGFHFTLQK